MRSRVKGEPKIIEHFLFLDRRSVLRPSVEKYTRHGCEGSGKLFNFHTSLQNGRKKCYHSYSKLRGYLYYSRKYKEKEHIKFNFLAFHIGVSIDRKSLIPILIANFDGNKGFDGQSTA